MPCSSAGTPATACTRPPTAGSASLQSTTRSAARWRQQSASGASPPTPSASTSWLRPAPSSSGQPQTGARDVPSVIPPSPTLDDQFFWDAIAEGRLVFQRCAACGVVRHPPAPMCGECHSVEWDTHESAGHGSVYTWIVSHHPTKPGAEPRGGVLVEL